MNEIIQTIATTLTVMPIDVYILGVVLILWIIFVVLGLQKTYEAYFGLIVGLAIYLMLTVLLSPIYQTPDTTKIFSPKTSQFLIGSSVYLMFILFLLTPISGGIRFPETRNLLLRLVERAVIAAFLWILFGALIIGFASKTYIFNVDTAFTLLYKMVFFQEILAGKIGSILVVNLQNIVLIGVFFLLYKILFSDIISVIILSLWLWILSLRIRGSRDNKLNADGDVHVQPDDHSHDDHGGHDDHGDSHEDHGGHDNHGHGGH